MTPCTLLLALPLMVLSLPSPTSAQDLAGQQDVDENRTSIPSQELRLEVYNFADLIGLPKVEAVQAEMSIMLEGDTATVPDYRAKQEELSKTRERAQVQAQALADVLKLHMRPKFIEDRNSSRLLHRGLLVLLASPEQHDWVATFLAFQREPQGFLQIEARMITVPQGTMSDLGVSGSAQIFENDAEFEALLRSIIASGPDVEVVTAPKIVARPLQKATVSILNQVAYVSDYELVIVEPGKVEIADPVIDVIQEGVVFEVRAVPLSPGIYGVEVDLSQTTLLRPMRTYKSVIGAGRHEVTYTLPEVVKRGIHTQLTLADGASALFVSPDGPVASDGRDLVIIFRLRHIPEGEWDLLQTGSRTRQGGK